MISNYTDLPTNAFLLEARRVVPTPISDGGINEIFQSNSKLVHFPEVLGDLVN